MTTPILNETTGLDVRINKHLPYITTTAEDGTVSRHVPIQVHLDLMDERDDYRRVVALINAARCTNSFDLRYKGMGDFLDHLTKLLSSVGENDVTGRAMQSIIASFQSGDLHPGAAERTDDGAR